MARYLASLVGALVLSASAWAQAPTPNLDRLTPESRKAVEEAAPLFVRTGADTYWDTQLAKQRADFQTSLKGRDMSKLAPETETKARSYNLSENGWNAQWVPLWFSLAEKEGATKGWGGCALVTDDEIAAASTTAPKGEALADGQSLVSERLLKDGSAIGFVRAANPEYKEWATSVYRAGKRPPAPPQYVDSPTRIHIVGAGFKVDGEAKDGVTFVPGEPFKDEDGRTMPTMIVSPKASPTDNRSPVSAEELAKAIAENKAELSKWTWKKGNGKPGTWERVRVPVKPSEPKP